MTFLEYCLAFSILDSACSRKFSTVGAGVRAFLGLGRVGAAPTQQVRGYCQKPSASEIPSPSEIRSLEIKTFFVSGQLHLPLSTLFGQMLN
ncbi:uncharacterized protein LOC107794604 isoform X2 [Nicotiana tabacum]|uniref:Uncharacterized protein LOC107794604 isoform X2 n=2 Tax=Nicotiana tabacum TaxID=4097 RepID=A0AC58U171_TOBAC